MSNQLPNLDAYWMPFTGNRYFKKNPRLFKKASGMFYTTHEDEQLLDAVSGLWCCNAGHCHPRIVEAVQKQAETLDYATAFQLGHPKIFEMANNHMGDVKHGKRTITKMSNISKRHGIRGGVKFQFRNLDTFIHPDFIIL